MKERTDIHFRLLKEEREAIAKAAAAVNKNLSEYARDVLLAASDYKTAEIITNAQKLSYVPERRNVPCYIRLTKTEADFYAEQAGSAGCSVSEYIRRSANGNQIIVIPGLKEMTKQMAKLGVNLNQLTMLAHQGKIREVDLFATNDTLKQMLLELIKISKKGG